jgi:3-(3-hydroxy-phenyl)propionate hydroxylase
MKDQNHSNSATLPSYDLVIVGYGMVGSIASMLALNKKLKVAVIENSRVEDLYVIKSGRIDHEVYRLLVKYGLVDNSHQYSPLNGVQIVDEDKKILHELEFLTHQGFSPMYSFSQEELQRTIHKQNIKIGNYYLEVFDNHSFEAFEQKEDRVRILVKNNLDDNIVELNTRFLIACNGINSLIPAQCELEYTHYEHTIFSLNVETKTQKVLNGKKAVQTLVDNELSISFYSQGDFVQRWEFNVKSEKMADSNVTGNFNSRIKTILDSPFDVNKTFFNVYDIKVLDEWQRKRIFISGDAAHVMPPFLGLSLSAGIKDVHNLIWKIALVADRKVDGKVLDYYQQERTDSVRFLIYLNLAFHRIFNSSWLKIVKVVLPIIPKFLLKRKINIESIISSGLIGNSKLRGTVIPPFYFNTISEKGISIDRLLRYNFTIISLDKNPVDLLSPNHIEYLAIIDTNFVQVVNKNIYVARAVRVTEKWLDVESRFFQWCKKNRIQHIILRPDQIIFDTCKDLTSLKKSIEILKKIMPLRVSNSKK